MDNRFWVRVVSLGNGESEATIVSEWDGEEATFRLADGDRFHLFTPTHESAKYQIVQTKHDDWVPTIGCTSRLSLAIMLIRGHNRCNIVATDDTGRKVSGGTCLRQVNDQDGSRFDPFDSGHDDDDVYAQFYIAVDNKQLELLEWGGGFESGEAGDHLDSAE